MSGVPRLPTDPPRVPSGPDTDVVFPASERVSSGIEGLDEVLGGGFVPDRAYLVRGGPGSGKTIMGLHFLTAAAADDVGGRLFISFEEPEAEIRANAAALGLDVAGVRILDMAPDSAFFAEHRAQSVFQPGDADGASLADRILEEVAEVNPSRVFLDPISQLRYYAADALEFRREVLSLVRYLVERGATVMFTSQLADSFPDDDLQFLSHGTLTIGTNHDVRSVSVTKFRGSDFAGGDHTFRIAYGGIQVFPRLRPGVREEDVVGPPLSSGVPEIDEMLHGGIEPGTVTIVSGPTGVGKSTLGTQFMKEAAGRSQHSVMYLFEEAIEALLVRSDAVNIPVRTMIDHGSLVVRELPPLAVSPDEFATMVRSDVEDNDAAIVMIDGIDGYRLSMGMADADLTRSLTSLFRFLKNRGVAVILVDEVGSVTTDFRATSEGISYLADNIVFIRNLEFDGSIHRTIGVLKKRLSDYGRFLRDFQITEHGLKVGEPLTGIQGVLSGDVTVSEEHGPDD